MRLLDETSPWLQNVSVSKFGIAVGGGGRFGIGAVLVIEQGRSGKLLFVRKAYRPGFEGNGQLAFPGGMVKANEPHATIESWIRSSLTMRVTAEVNLRL